MNTDDIEGPLPIVDAGSLLQEESIDAFKARLPRHEYLFRDDRKDDYGVDGTLELRSGGKATNILAQVQLKGRSNTQPNSDGAVPVQVETSNLNYLLNGICPFYVLYRRENQELRFAFAHDEWARLERQNPGWRSQKTVTLYFNRVLTNEAVTELRTRILEEAKLQRSVNQRLNSVRGTSARVVIDAQTLAVTDSSEALRLLGEVGQAMTNSGLAKAVVECSRLVSVTSLLGAPRAALAVAYAHFHLAHYHDASAALRQILLSAQSVPPGDRALLDMLFIATKRMLGELDQAGYEGEMDSWSKEAPPELAIQHDIARAWSLHLQTVASRAPEEQRASAEAKLRATFDKGARSAVCTTSTTSSCSS